MRSSAAFAEPSWTDMLFSFLQHYLLKGYHNIGALDILAARKQMPRPHKEIQTAFKFHLSGFKCQRVHISFVSLFFSRSSWEEGRGEEGEVGVEGEEPRDRRQNVERVRKVRWYNYSSIYR